MGDKLRAAFSSKVAGIPVPVIVGVLVVVAYLVIRRRQKAAAASTASSTDTTGADSSPIGGMRSGGYPGTDMAFPTADDTAAASDVTGDMSGAALPAPTPDAGSTTAAGGPTGSTVIPVPPRTAAPTHAAGALSAHQLDELHLQHAAHIKPPPARTTMHVSPRRHPVVRRRPVVRPKGTTR